MSITISGWRDDLLVLSARGSQIREAALLACGLDEHNRCGWLYSMIHFHTIKFYVCPLLAAQVSGNAAQAQLQANLTGTIVNMIQYWRGVDQTTFSSAQLFGIYTGWLILAAVTNSVGNRANIFFTEFGGWLNLVGILVLCIVVPAVATRLVVGGWLVGVHRLGRHE